MRNLNFTCINNEVIGAIKLTPEEVQQRFEEMCNNFLKTRYGLACLCKHYPNLSIIEAISKYKINAAWVDSIV